VQGTFAVSGIENSTEPERNGQTLAYVYGHPRGGLTLDEARRIARNPSCQRYSERAS